MKNPFKKESNKSGKQHAPRVTSRMSVDLTSHESDVLERSLHRFLQREFEATPLAKDLPRLVQRIDLMCPNSDSKCGASWNDLPANASVLDRMCQLLTDMAHHLEVAEVQANLSSKVSELRKGKASTSHPPNEIYAEDLLRAIGTESKTVTVLKCICQSVVFVAIQRLRGTVMEGLYARDVRSANGWRVQITLAPDLVSVSHFKREQSFGQDDEAFELEWELRLTFDGQVRDLQAAILRIQEVQFGAASRRSWKDAWRMRLLQGLIV